MPESRKLSLKVALIGGGPGCLSFMRMVESLGPGGLMIEVVGVADLNPEADGISYARDKGVLTTTDYRDLLKIEGLDLLIELTGHNSILADLSRLKPRRVGLVDHNASLLFYDAVSYGQKIDRQEEEISVARSFSKALMAATTAGVVVVDPQYHIIWANKVAAQRSGLSPKEAQGKYCFQVLHQALTPCSGPLRTCPLKETLERGKVAHATHEVTGPDGGTVIYDATTYPLFNRKGEVVQVVDIFRDITADLASQVERRTKAIKEDLARLVQEDKLVSLGKLVASVAHEINNPISSIINFNQLMLKTLRERPPEEKDLAAFDRYLDLSIREAKRSGKIVQSLLSFSRQKVMEPRQVDLAEILDLIVVLTRHRIELAKIKLEFKLGRGPLEVWGDYAQLQQCFMNLVFNAVEAMDSGGLLTISGGRNKVQNSVWIEISDTGHGIPAELREHIFEPFVSTKTATSGVGLGLSMVYGIIRGHRGAIQLESEVGQGTTFRVTLPISAEADLREKETP